jgi:hypothetical protein
MVIPLAFIALNLMRYLWATRAVSRSGPWQALGALRVNLSLSWVIFLACYRGMTQDHGVFMRTSKFKGPPAVGELRLVAVETVLAATGLALGLAVLAVAGFTVVGLVLAALLAWSVLIYGSATGYALGDPAREPLSEVLLEKARLEIGLGLGHAVEKRPVRISIAVATVGFVLLMGGGVAAESGQVPVQGAGPLYSQPVHGPLVQAKHSTSTSSSPVHVPPGHAKSPKH